MSEPLIIGCSFIGNDWFAIDCLHSDPTIVNCLITGNNDPFGGGGINLDNSDAVILNCTIVDNKADLIGGGIFASNSVPTIANCIVRGNTPNEIFDVGLAVSYSNVQGGYAGEGNIDADAMFADPDDGDFHVLAGSPCIDAGDSDAVPDDVTTDLDGNPRFVDDPDTDDTGLGYPCVDMGAFEFQVELSCPEDVNGDDVVDIDDLFDILAHWGDGPGSYDVNDDGIVDIDDVFAVLAAWGPCE